MPALEVRPWQYTVAKVGDAADGVLDTVIGSGKINAGAPSQNADCLRCYFGVRDTLSAASDGYEKDFGAALAFRAGLHAGTVVIGELGDSKQEIAFLGDTVNAASRVSRLSCFGSYGPTSKSPASKSRND